MQTRIEITEIKHSLWKYPELRESMTRMDDEVLTFCNLTGRGLGEPLKLLNARRHFETCLTLCKSLIDPQTNEYIDKVNDNLHSYDKFLENIGNSLAVLDKLESEFESIEKLSSSGIPDRHLPKINFKSYKFREKLKDYMENMIILPFLSAIKNFYNFPNETEKGKIIKDKKLFMYLLFRELYSSAEIKGSEKRQLQFLTGTGKVNMQETNIYKTGKGRPQVQEVYEDTSPPEIPENIHFDPFADTDEEVTEDVE